MARKKTALNASLPASEKAGARALPQAAQPKPTPAILSIEPASNKELKPFGCPSAKFDAGPISFASGTRSTPPAGALSVAAVIRKIWDKTHLSVSFVDADQYDPSGLIRSRIKAVAQLWSEASLGGINFDWYNGMTYDADVRVSLTPDGTFWSLVGTDSRLSGSNLVTMNLGFNNTLYYTSDDTSEFYVRELHRLTLHEFGHALGFIHEHLSPASQIKFDKQATIDYFQKLCGWSAEQTISQVLTPEEGQNLTTFDMQSVMIYPFPASIATPPTDNNWQLSQDDIDSVRKAYPKSRRLLERPGSPLNVMPEPTVSYLMVADYPLLFRFQAPATAKYNFEALPAYPTEKNPLEVIGLVDLSDPLRAVALAQGIAFRIFREKTSESGETQLVEEQASASKPVPDHFAEIIGFPMKEGEFCYLEARNILGHTSDWSRFRLKLTPDA